MHSKATILSGTYTNEMLGQFHYIKFSSKREVNSSVGKQLFGTF